MATKKQERQETQVAILTPKKVRGTATIYACGDVEFKAYGEGTPQKEVIKRKGNSQLYETKPVKGTTPKLCAHLMVDKDDPAVGMKLRQQLDDFLDGIGDKCEDSQPAKKDAQLWKGPRLNVWHRAKQQDVLVTLTLTLDESRAMEQEALNEFQKLYQCFTFNKEYLHRAALAQKKNGSE